MLTYILKFIDLSLIWILIILGLVAHSETAVDLILLIGHISLCDILNI